MEIRQLKHEDRGNKSELSVVETHLEETEVSWCQSSKSDDHFCCWSFSDEPTNVLQEKKGRQQPNSSLARRKILKFVIHQQFFYTFSSESSEGGVPVCCFFLHVTSILIQLMSLLKSFYFKVLNIMFLFICKFVNGVKLLSIQFR